MQTVFMRLITIIAIMWSASATSAVVEYTDLATWDSASEAADTDLTFIDWSLYTIPSGNCCSTWDGTDGVNDNVAFTNVSTGNPPLLVNNNTDFGNGPVGLGSGIAIFGGGLGIRVDLPATSLGIAVDLRGYQLATTVFEIMLDTGELFTKTVNNPAGGFFGIISDSAISSVTFAAAQGSDAIIMDNVWVATEAADTNPVPAPGGLILLAGLMGLALSRLVKN